MAKRLTPARIERWQADQAKAHALLTKVEREIAEYRIAAKGGRLSNLTNAMLSLRVSRDAISNAGVLLNLLYRSETR